MSTPNLDIAYIDVNQAQKEVTANEATLQLEMALTELVDVEVIDGTNSIATLPAQRSFCLKLVAGSPAPSATFGVELPAVRRPIAIRNATGEDADVYVIGDGNIVTIESGGAALLYSDGTTVVALAGGSSSGATAFTGLTDAPSSYTGAALLGVVVNPAETGLQFSPPPDRLRVISEFSDYTLAAVDYNTLIVMDSAAPVDLVVPEDATAALPTGGVVRVMQFGVGQVTVVPESGAVDVYTTSAFTTPGQFSVVELVKLDANIWSLRGAGAAPILQINAQTGTSYALVSADNGKMITLDNAAPVSIEVPLNSTTAIPVGFQAVLAQIGAGKVTLSPVSGVTIITPETLSIGKQGGHVALTKSGADTWLLEGNLEAL